MYNGRKNRRKNICQDREEEAAAVAAAVVLEVDTAEVASAADTEARARTAPTAAVSTDRLTDIGAAQDPSWVAGVGVPDGIMAVADVLAALLAP